MDFILALKAGGSELLIAMSVVGLFVLIAQYSSGIVELVVWASIDQLRWPDLVGSLCLQSD